MNNSVASIIFFFFTLSMTAQISSENIPFPTQNAIKKFELKEGLIESDIKMTDFSKWKMMFSIPKINDGNRVDVVLALHWGIISASYDKFMECLILPSFDQGKYLIIAPHAESQAWWTSPKKEQLISLIQSIRQYWPVDKVIVTGYSDACRINEIN